MRDDDYEKIYSAWFEGLPKNQKRLALQMNVDRPLCDEQSHGGSSSGFEGFSLTAPHAVSEANACKLARANSECLEIVTTHTPLDEICKAEEGNNIISEIEIGAISALLAFMFRKKGSVPPTLKDVLLRFYLLTYSINPSLLGSDFSLEKVGKEFGLTRAALSKANLNQNALLNLKSRNSKSSAAVAKYSQSASRYHATRIAAEKKAKRQEYQKSWARKNADKVKVSNAAYFAANKERLLAAQKAARAKGRKASQ